MKPQVDSNHYFNQSYDTKKRFISYWHQIHEIFKLNPGKVLEIGVGNKFVSNYIKERKMNIVTFDFDEKLGPDVVGNILNMPFEDNSFDVVACYEVLEHLPYKNFRKALDEIFRVSKAYSIVSLPDKGWVCRFNMKVPKLVEIKKLVTLPRLIKSVHVFNGEHYWEIGADGYSLKNIVKDIQKVGFKIDRTYRVFECPYHRFFILRK